MALIAMAAAASDPATRAASSLETRDVGGASAVRAAAVPHGAGTNAGAPFPPIEGDRGPEAIGEFFTKWFGEVGFPMTWSDRIDLREDWRRIPNEPTPTLLLAGWQFVGPLAISSAAAYPNQHWSFGRVNWFEDLPGLNRYRIAAPTGGLWELDGNVANPIPLSDNIDAPFGLVCATFATHPLDEDTILMGSGTQDFGNGSGLWKTDDRGQTWTSIPVDLGIANEPSKYYRIRYDPNNPQRVHLATDTGLWLSTDGGSTFTRIIEESVTEVVFVPWSPAVLYAAVASGDPGSGIYRSSDGGDSYSRLEAGGAPIDDVARTSMAVTPSTSPQVTALYATVDQGIGPRIYKSVDDGQIWTDITPAALTECLVRGWYNNSIAVHPFIPSRVAVGGVCLLWSSDAGQNWDWAEGIHSDFHAIGFDGSTLYVGNDAGLQSGSIPGPGSTNFGWFTPVWFPIAQTYETDISPSDPEKGIYGMQDNGIATTFGLIGDGGIVHWRRGGDAGGVAINPEIGSWYAVDVGDTLTGPLLFWNYTGLNQGQNWEGRSSGIQPSGQFVRHVRSPRVPIPGRRVVTYSDNRVYGSTDEGLTWDDLSVITAGAFQDITIADTAGDNIWAVSDQKQIVSGRVYYRSGDGTWSERSDSLPNANVCMRVVPSDPLGSRPLQAYALMGPGNSNGPANGNRIFFTSDAGQDWNENLTGNLPAGLPIFDLAENPVNPNILYLATAAGAMRTVNRGATWMKWNFGWPSGAIVTRLQIIEQPTGAVEVYGTTYGRGLWRRDISSDLLPPTSVAHAPSAGLSLRVLRNPGVGGIEFRFDLSAPGSVRLEIVDVEGRRVGSMSLSGRVGSNRASWEGRDPHGRPVASGVYFASLRAGQQVSRVRFVLTR